MQQQQPQPQTVPSTMPLMVTLEAQQWNGVMTALTEVPLPHRFTNPLIQAITEQLQQQATMQLSAGSAAVAVENGLDHDPPPSMPN